MRIRHTRHLIHSQVKQTVMADIELHRSLGLSMLQGQYVSGDDSLYHVYDTNNNPSAYYPEHYYEDLMVSGSNYQQAVYRGCAGSDLDDSHDSDDSSVMLDIDTSDLEMIERYEEQYCIKTETPEQCCSNFCGQYQQVFKPSQASHNLPAFETLFNPKRTSINRLCHSQMTDSEDDEESNSICRKGKRGAKNVLLWKFLLEELKIGKHVEWTDISQGTFRFVDTSEISRLWGQKKRKDDMNFEKLSRGIRHYYKSGFMSRQEGTRLIYRFNWAKVPKKYRQFDIKRGVALKHTSY